MTLNILYYCATGKPWNPILTSSLNESENAILNLVDQWSKMTHIIDNIFVFGNFLSIIKKNHYSYLDQNTFSDFFDDHVVNKYGNYGNDKYYILIVCGLSANQILPILIKKYGTGVIHDSLFKIIWDCHDPLVINSQFSKTIFPYVDHILVKSKYHASIFSNQCELEKCFPNVKLSIIGNGVPDTYFEPRNIVRDKYNMFYDGEIAFGLYQALKFIFPQIKKRIPQMNFHVMYTHNFPLFLGDGENFEEFEELFKQKGVKRYFNLPNYLKEKIKRESYFHLHFTNTSLEIDNVFIKESTILGCVPIISNEGVYKHRYGAHYELDDLEGLINFIDSFVNLETDESREEFSESVIRMGKYKGNDSIYEPIYKWSEVANMWLNIISFGK